MNSSQSPSLSLKRRGEALKRRAELIHANLAKYLATSLTLLIVGHLALFSASTGELTSAGKFPYSTILKQLAFTGIGILVALLLGYVLLPRLKDATLSAWVGASFLLSLAFTLLTLISGLGSESYGASRWLNLFGLRFQPSEFLKPALILFLTASLLRLEKSGALVHLKNARGDISTQKRGNLPVIGLYAVILFSVAVIMLQPHLGMAGLIFTSSIITLWLIGVPTRSILKLLLVMAIVGGLSYFVIPEKFQYAGKRISAFIDPMKDVSGEGYQIVQSMGAISEAGFFGKGYMRGLQKYGRLPLADRDFIFAIWTEETGLVGAGFVVFLFLALLFFGIRLSALLPFGFESVSISALTFLLVLQAILNISSNVAILPISGLTLPFFSYGGSSIIASLAIVGTVLGLAKRVMKSPQHKKGKKEENEAKW